MDEARKTVHTELREMEAVILETLASGGEVSFSPKGRSMLPMLRDGGDSVTLKAPEERIPRGAVALFVTNEGGGRRFVLHRLVKKSGGRLVFCGDNRRECDEPVDRAAVVGVVVRYESRGKKHSLKEPWYRVYCAWMVATYGVRSMALKLQKRVYLLWKRLRKRA